MRALLKRLAVPVIVLAMGAALALLAYDAGARSAAAYRALHDHGRYGTFVADSCGRSGCVGAFYRDVRTRTGKVDAVIEGRYRPGEQIPAVFVDGRALPRQRSVYLYPGLVALASALGLAGVVGYGIVRPLRRRTRVPAGR
ncbi:MAG: hypothetical protein GEV03_19885 [Streptosporangiales bacterium]|nr:hypothetical protein [Streptosporangiales bacterium]